MSESYPISKVDPKDTMMDLSCILTRSLLFYLEDQLGEAAMQDVVNDTHMNLGYLRNANNWVSYEYYCRFLQRIVDVTGDSRAPYTASLLYNGPKSTRNIGVFISRMGTPRTFLKLVCQFACLWSKINEWELISIGKNTCVIAVKFLKYKQDPNNCLAIQGCFAGIPGFFGLPSAEVKHQKCACDGGSECVYELSWVNKPECRWGYAGALAGAGLGAGIIMLTGYSIPNMAIMALLTGLGLSFGRETDYRMRLKNVYDQNEAQADSLLESIRDIEKFNKELQAKVEIRTKELKSANVSLQDALLEQQRSEVKALRAERQAAVGVLAAGMAHEINNPVNAIRLSLQTLLRKVDKGDPMHELVDNASIATSRCTRIVNDLLTFARNEQNLTQVDLKNVLQRSVDIFLKEDARGVDVDLSIDEDVPMVQVDAQQMQQAILNLMINAGDAMNGKGEIDISLAREGGDVVLRHQDSGPGIDESMKARIFDPFFSTKKGGSSKGLGLSITVALVGRNNGKIDVESESGKGACFVLRFPAENIEKGPM